MQTHRYDVVIVGAGGAGMRAALEAGQRARTAVLTKLYPTRSHTGAAQGGMCAALANVEDDNWEWHTFDTVKGGDYLVDQDAAEVMCKEAIDAVLDLEKMGLPFNRTPEGRIDQRRFGGHTRNHGEAAVRRSCFAADRTGHMILQTLYQQCVKHEVEFFNEFYVLDLLLVDAADARTGREIEGLQVERPEGGSGGADGSAGGPVGGVPAGKRVAGVVAYELATGEIHVFQAKSVVFATGGAGKVYKTTSNAHTLTGDGMGIAYRRGLPLEDMEFFQFHPTGLAGLGILLSEAARGEGGILRNADGERFMERYAPTIKDLAPRDIVARSMANEVREGRGAGPNKDYVLLDLTHLEPAHIDAKLPDITEFARTYLGVEPYTEPVPVYPTAHYAMGGVPTNVDAEVLSDNTTVVPGLYAAGEVACVSVHGSNRLGTNSLLDINVFGKRAGIAAAEYANRADWVALPEAPEAETVEMLESIRNRPAGERYSAIRTALQETMDANAQVFRTEGTLKQALSDIDRLKERYSRVSVQDKGKRYNTDLLEAVEVGFLLDLAEVIVLGALERKESRGGHFREDYPHRDDVNFMRHTMVYRERGADGTLVNRLDFKPVVQTRYQPMERKY
ncbi:FAD-binding protein [Kineococcus glutinatus]|uniref:succinate dehydrogenase n=1 Tax=Kineococcus glutinatus TaxID=1070872 RepID=A0ABP9HRQ2_9ACTN